MSIYCDDVVTEFYSERNVKARKPYKCCETGREIANGEKYWRCSGKTDGDFWSVAQSEAAYRFARKLNGVEPFDQKQQDDYGCIGFGGIGECMEEMRSDVPNDLVAEWDAIMKGESAK